MLSCFKCETENVWLSETRLQQQVELNWAKYVLVKHIIAICGLQ